MRQEPTKLGATYLGDFTRFRVWSPAAQTVNVTIDDGREIRMDVDCDGFWQADVRAVSPGTLYSYHVDARGPFPDPASRFQPQGVHGPSAVIDPDAYIWTEGEWTGIALDETVIYELHIGTFTPEGTFAAAAAKLSQLAELGITAVELMPVADFPGNRNWGYDGVCLFSPARCYGTPDQMRDFVNRAHQLKLAVFLDVVYNHFGPDGAYHGIFSQHYYSKAHRSPWGDGLNFDGPLSGPVREFFAENAVRWLHEYRLDGLRLDATHAIVDESPVHFLAFLTQAVRNAFAGEGRTIHLIAEDHRNLARMVKPGPGWEGMNAVWADDLHHQIRRALAGDSDGYFQDFDGSIGSVVATAGQGWFYSGQYAPHFGGPRGSDPAGIAYERFVTCIQNHDQIGNRAFGDRLHHTIDLSAFRAATTLLLLLPETPLLFMGQEWAATSPFQFFTDHNEELGRLVTAGRRREFGQFKAFADPALRESIPDPQAISTFENSKLCWDERDREPHQSTLRFYRRLLGLRRTDRALRTAGTSPSLQIAAHDDSVVLLRRESGGERMLAVIRFLGAGSVKLQDSPLFQSPPDSPWRVGCTSEEDQFAADPSPPRIELPYVHFARPGAVLLFSAGKECV